MRLVTFLLFFANLILFSNDIKKITIDEIVLNYVFFDKLEVNKNEKKTQSASYYFFSKEKKYFKIEVFNKLTSEKILFAETDAPFYFEFFFDAKKNKILIKNLLGEFVITSYNSFFDNYIENNNIRIFNFYSSYKIFSLPKNIIFLDVIEGKINVLKESNSLILIAGEKCEINNESIILSEIKDFQTAKIIFLSRFKAKYDKDELGDPEKIFY
ncbi:MAG TPA: hypothetical protein PLO89_04120 [Spirochaetota bacterium]|nr:hypothetical protein [Spirochaetota bacterium]